MKKLPTLSFWQIWNLSFGFLGVQIGYSLQNANTSRIFESLGADVHSIGLFWLAAPLSGLLVQPIIGMASDSVWTRIGRRLPFILFGSIVSCIAMFLMPNAEQFVNFIPALVFGAIMLLLMDTSFNVAMQPFRALVGDKLNEDQLNLGYSIQSALINFGAVFGSLLPVILTAIGVANIPAEGAKVADSVIWSFYIGGSVLISAVLWTVFTTKEYPPQEHAEYHNIQKKVVKEKVNIFQILAQAPKVFWQLGVVQFFSWFSLFLMWVYTTRAIANQIWGGGAHVEATSKEFNDAGNWVGWMFAIYSAVAAGYSFLMPAIAKRIGRKGTYGYSLLFGGLSLLSMFLIHDKYVLFGTMVGVGIAWAAILAMPYAILSKSVPAERSGVYMGLFNMTITIPQITSALLGSALALYFKDNAMAIIAISGISMMVAGAAVYFVEDKVTGETSFVGGGGH